MAIEDIGKNALQVLEKRYLAKDAEGNHTEDVAGLFRRVAAAVAPADRNYDENADTAALADSFYELMTSLRFLPNSPTLMNAGRPLGQLSACFVLPVEDSMEAIFETVKNAALIHKSGGGTGFSFSRLRQNGAPVNSTGGVASGPVSFMRVFNMATEAVKQGGTRRGANMGILRVDHPDILEFIDCKKVNGDITNFNISVGITEAFMQAVEENRDYDLIDPQTRRPVGKRSARELFEKIVDAAWRNGEPGIIFLDRLNRDNVVPSQGEIESTNPCGEQPLLPYESCNLGSINLVKMLAKTPEGYAVDYGLLRDTVRQAIHFLDNVIDVNNYPLEQIGAVTRATRKIGLGVMGFADMLLYLGVPYNSDEGVALAEKLMAFINAEGHAASTALAAQRGAFPLFAESIYKDGDPPAQRHRHHHRAHGYAVHDRRLLLRRGACVCLCVYPQHHGRYGDAGGKPGAAGKAAGARTVLRRFDAQNRQRRYHRPYRGDSRGHPPCVCLCPRRKPGISYQDAGRFPAAHGQCGVQDREFSPLRHPRGSG